MNINTKDNFPIIGATDFGGLLNRNGDLTLCYKVVFANLNTLSSDDYENIRQNFKNGFADLLPGTIIHAQTFFNNEDYMPGDVISSPSNESFLGMANERLLYEKKFKVTTSFLLFTLTNIHPLKKSLSGSNIFNNFLKVDKKFLSEEKITKFINGVENYLRAINQGFDFEFELIDQDNLLGKNNLLNICERYMMLSQDKQTPFKDVVYNKNENYLKVGENYVGIFEIDNVYCINDTISSYNADRKLSTEISFFPSAMSKTFTHKIDGECIYNVVIYKEDTSLVQEELQKLIRFKKSVLSLSEENEKSLEDTVTFLKNLLDDSMRLFPVRLYSNVIYWTDKSHLDFKILKSNVAEGFKTSDLIPYECNEELPIVFMNSMPGNAGNIGADQYILTYDMVAFSFLNFEETFSFDGKSALGLSMVNRNGARVVVDAFAETANSRQRKAITGYNFFCLGPTGSGKSVYMNYMVRWAVESGAFVMLVDVGHSYENLCKNYFKGSYFEFGENLPLKINPFKIEGKFPSERRIQMIMKILLKAWKGEELPTVIEEGMILQSINFYYNYIEVQAKQGIDIELKFDTYFDYLSKVFREKELPLLNTSQKFNINHFLDVLKLFYKGGIYEHVLNANFDIDLKNERFIVFELDGIKANKLLFPLVVLYMMGTFEEILKEKPNQRKYLIIEEAWKAIMSEMFAEYIKELYKTTRKAKGTIGLVTQELDDLLSSEIIKDTVISQSDVTFVLTMAKYMKKMEKIASTLSLEDKHVAILLSLNKDISEGDRFREIFIKWSGQVYGVYGVLLSHEEYWTYTTEAIEKNLVKFLLFNEFKLSFKNTINFLAKLSAELNNYQEVIEYCNKTFNYDAKVKINPKILTHEYSRKQVKAGAI